MIRLRGGSPTLAQLLGHSSISAINRRLGGRPKKAGRATSARGERDDLDGASRGPILPYRAQAFAAAAGADPGGAGTDRRCSAGWRRESAAWRLAGGVH